MFMELVASEIFWRELLSAELTLTVSIVASLAVGEVILAFGLVDRLFAPVIPFMGRIGIHEKIAAAMLMSLGTSRAAAGLISGAYSDGEITRREAVCGTLSLAFPGYLRRWVVTAATAAGLAGRAGFIFACALLARSACRFIWVVAMLAGGGGRMPCGAAQAAPAVSWEERARRTFKLLRKSLPWAWVFFALTYALVPLVDRVFSERVAEWKLYSVLPAEGWAVVISSLAHVTAAYSAAAGALSSGRLGVGQAVLALLVGNMLGSVTRTMRQNVGYWVGVFPKDLVPKLLRWHLVTNVTLELVSIFIAWCASEVVFFG